MTHPVKAPKKLIEVALPLDAINVASVRESYIYKGNPSSLHKWWAQRPLAAARAVIFSQMVNDPSWKWELEHSGKIPPNNLKASWAASRKRLFKIIEDLVLWENTTNEEVLEKAREEIRKSWRETCELNKDHPDAATLFDPEKLPALHDPFAGGGTIPLEAQRLGLEAYASDLNPVAVLINKAMIEIPSKFASKPPVNPEAHKDKKLFSKTWKGAEGLADDVRYYGKWMRDEAELRAGHLYPKVEITEEIVRSRPDLKPLLGLKLTVIAWLWARTVKSPNPAYSHVDVPLASTFMLSTRRGKESYVEPLVDKHGYRFVVQVGVPKNAERSKNGTKLARANFRCVMSGVPIAAPYIMSEGKAGRIAARLMAIAVESDLGRTYLSPTESMEEVARGASPDWGPDVEFFQQALGFRVGNYGLTKWSDLFTRRQLATLSKFSDVIEEARSRVRTDALRVFRPKGESTTGEAADAYANAVSVYLAFALDKHLMYGNSLVPWYPKESRPSMLFSQQVLSMVWDFAEVNPFSEIGGSFTKSITIVASALEGIPTTSRFASAMQHDAAVDSGLSGVLVSTDPPYYDNVGYADLSDFFYVWLRHELKSVYPDLFATRLVPKTQELVATPERHGGKDKAESFFLQGMTQAMHCLVKQASPALPVSIYYAFKQSENDGADGTASTGWETFLAAVLRAGLLVCGTWPMRTERTGRMRDSGSNALASSIVLVCRPRAHDAPTVARREFVRELSAVLPEALDEMTRGAGDNESPVAPVDLSQAIIGPGMAVFSKYAAVLEADGTPMTVRTALQLINRFLAEDDFDADTQFSLRWFEQHGWENGQFGEADTLARAKATSVDGLKQAGVVLASAGKVRLLKWSEYPKDWKPEADDRLPIWEVLHHLIRALKQDGESSAGRVLAAVQAKGEAARQLAYRLYTLCERTGKAEDARAYNELVTSWNAIESAASAEPAAPKRDTRDMFKKQGNKP